MSTPKYNKLHSKRVLILGGTSSIGYAVAEGCLEFGAYVTIASSTTSRLESALSALKTSYPSAASAGLIVGTTCDVSKESTIEEQLHSLFTFATTNGMHKLDHVVNTAGTVPSLPALSKFTPDQAFGGATSRYIAGLLIGKLAPAHMNPGPGSSIIFTGGSTASKPGRGWSARVGLGALLEGMMRGLAIDLAPIRVNLVGLGVVDTPLLRRFTPTQEVFDKVAQGFAADNLLGVVGKPEDAAEAYLYFMRDRFVTGQLLLTDGGRLLMSPGMHSSTWTFVRTEEK